MKYLSFALAAGLLLASCARPNTPPPPRAEPIGLDSPIPLRLHAGDSGVAPQEVVRRRLFGLLPPKQVAASPLSPLSGKEGVPRKCKGCTFNLVAGNQTNSVVGKKATAATAEGAVASVVGKKAGPAVVASDSAALNSVEGGGNLAAVHGDGNHLEQKAERPPEKSLLATIWDNFKPALLIGGGVLGVAAVTMLLVNTPAGPWLAGLLRRKKSTPNQA